MISLSFMGNSWIVYAYFYGFADDKGYDTNNSLLPYNYSLPLNGLENNVLIIAEEGNIDFVYSNDLLTKLISIDNYPNQPLTEPLPYYMSIEVNNVYINKLATDEEIYKCISSVVSEGELLILIKSADGKKYIEIHRDDPNVDTIVINGNVVWASRDYEGYTKGWNNFDTDLYEFNDIADSFTPYNIRFSRLFSLTPFTNN